MASRTCFSRSILWIGTLIWILAFEALPTPAVSQVAFWNKQCVKLYADWKKRPGHKAFAVTHAYTNTGQSCGFSYGVSTKATAEKEAIRQCKLDRWGVSSTCHVIKSD